MVSSLEAEIEERLKTQDDRDNDKKIQEAADRAIREGRLPDPTKS
jgi:hypothetical protein